jgi:hypothetical protein
MESTDLESTWRKSSYSGNGGGNCVEVSTWRKSSYSGNGGGSCVEVGNAGVILVRDTKDRSIPALVFSAEAWQTFTSKLK